MKNRILNAIKQSDEETVLFVTFGVVSVAAIACVAFISRNGIPEGADAISVPMNYFRTLHNQGGTVILNLDGLGAYALTKVV